MGRAHRARNGLAPQADLAGVDLEPGVLVVGNPLRNQPLAVPRDVRPGDTPEGEPAVWWMLPPERDRFLTALDWAAGGTARSAFWAFLDLAEEPDPERFVGFARRFGVLGLWDYRTESGHRAAGEGWVPSVTDRIRTPHRFAAFADPDEFAEKEADDLLGMMYEPVAEWRRWAGEFRAAVQVAVALRADEGGRASDWAALGLGHEFDPETASPGAPFARDLLAQRRALAAAVQTGFLRWSGLVPVLRWDAGGPRLDLALGGRHAVRQAPAPVGFVWPENSLFPALVAQLVAVVVAGEPVALCAGCGRLHPRDQKPRPDQPAYCGEACRAAARRKTKRESARKRRATASGSVAATPITTPIPADASGRQRAK